MEGTIFDIQHFSVHDGPGIRTLVFLKGCPLRCKWCCNPESQSFEPQMRFQERLCRQCGRCENHTRLEHCCTGALSLTGKSVTAEWVVEQVKKDAAFYRNSGGGVTFSGGEPTAQPGFLKELLQQSQGQGLHTAVETTGFCTEETLLALEPFVNLFLFDIKAAHEDRHKAWTGVSWESIAKNLRMLHDKCPEKLIVRLPLIPGFSASPDAVHDVIQFLHALRGNGVQRFGIELLPFHPFGFVKAQEHGLSRCEQDYAESGLMEASFQEEELRRVCEAFHNSGLKWSMA